MANTFKRQLSRSVGTTATLVGSYSVAAATQATVIGLAVANTSAGLVNVSVSLFDGTNDTYLVKTCPVPAGGSVVIVGGDQKVVLQTGDGIHVSSDTASSVDVIMSVLEMT